MNRLNELDISGNKGRWVERLPRAEVIEVVGADVDYDGVGGGIRGEGVAVVRIALAVAGPELGDQRAAVGLVVARQADAAVRNDAIGCIERLGRERAVGLWVVLDGGGVGAGGRRAVEAVAYCDGIANDLDSARWSDVCAKGPIGSDAGNGDRAHIGFRTFTELDGMGA